MMRITNKLIAKHYNLIIKALGGSLFLIGLFLTFENVVARYDAPEGKIFWIFSLILSTITIFGAYSFLKEKTQIGWAIIVGNLSFWLSNKVFQLISFLELVNILKENAKRDDLLEMVNVMVSHPTIVVRNQLFIIGILMILISVLNNSQITNNYKINYRVAYLSIVLGLLISFLNAAFKPHLF